MPRGAVSEPDQSWSCPTPADAGVAPAPTFGERLKRRTGRSQHEPRRTTPELALTLKHVDHTIREEAQRALENHTGSLLTWKASDGSPQTGPWFTGVLHLTCLKVWRSKNGDRLELHEFEELVNEVYAAYIAAIMRPGGRGIQDDEYPDEPWKAVCGYIGTAARRRLSQDRRQGVSATGFKAIKQLTVRQTTLEEIRRAMVSGQPAPSWVIAAGDGMLSDQEARQVLDALLDTGDMGQTLTLPPRLDAAARVLIGAARRLAGETRKHADPDADAADASEEDGDDD